MIEGTVIKLADNIHKATIIKEFSNQNCVIECIDKQLSFTRLVEYDEIANGNIHWVSWATLFYRR